MLPEDFYKKNLEMWEKFTSSYMDTMFKTVEKTLEQSKVFKDRVDKAVTSAVETQMDATMSIRGALNATARGSLNGW